MVLIEKTGHNVRIAPFSDEYESMQDVPVARCAAAYDCPNTGKIYILDFPEALYLGDRLQDSLICPNQLRHNGLKVDETPTQFDKTSTHSIIVPNNSLTIPMSLQGTVSYFEARKPTEEELRTSEWVRMTHYDNWDPHSDHFRVAEESAKRQRRMAASLSSNEDARLRMERAEETSITPPTADLMIADFGFPMDDTEEGEHDGTGEGDTSGTDNYRVAKVSTGGQALLTKETLARRWGIGLETAAKTLGVTTQHGIRNVVTPATRRYKTRAPALRQFRLPGRFYTDTMFATSKSIRGYKCAQVFTNGNGFDFFLPMQSKSEAPWALQSLVHEYGIPSWITSDNAPELSDGKWSKLIREYRIRQTWTEPYSPWQNLCEAAIREIKKGIRRFTARSGSPKRLWCFLGEWFSGTRRLTAHTMDSLKGRVPAEAVVGQTPDISTYAQFDWYEPVRYIDNDHELKTGRCLGPANGVGAGNCFWILPMSGRPVVRSTVHSLTPDEKDNPAINSSIKALDNSIQSKLGDTIKDDEVDDDLQGLYPSVDEVFEADSWEDETVMPQMKVEEGTPEADDYTPEAFDQYINSLVMMNRGGVRVKGRVIGRHRNADGVPIGKAHSNPIMDTRLYDIEFPDGSTDAYAANLVAENIYAQVDEEGKKHVIVDEIIDHRSDASAVIGDDSNHSNRHGKQHRRRTTRGWQLLVQWRDGTTDWIPLRQLKESFPVQVADYAVANKIASEPAFSWWVHDTLRRKDRILRKVRSKKYWVQSHQYGVRLPKSVAEALRIDEENGNTLWRDAIAKEMKNVACAFEFRDDDKVPIGYQHINYHMIFAVKMDLTRKGRLVANGNEMDVPKFDTFSTVVSRDSVRLAFMAAALNDIGVLAADIQNAYLSAPTKEKIYITAGKEFGKDEGRPAIIVRALYGVPGSGKNFRLHLAGNLSAMGYRSCRADPDVWLKPSTTKSGRQYYSYILAYVDDILVLHEEPEMIMDALKKEYTLKASSIKEPDVYLGADIKKWRIESASDPEKARWAMSSGPYIRRAIKAVEEELLKVGKGLPTRVTTPLSNGYRPELDVSDPLSPERLNYYQGLIGVLRWACELGRIDILMPVSMMSQYLASARQGHLQEVLHIFAYLKQHDRSSLVFDEREPTYKNVTFVDADWSDDYPGAEEAIPPDAPEPRGPEVVMTCYVDADHAGCRVTRRSHSGIIIFVNNSPILWYSKRQNTVEASTFGSEFIALRIAVEMIEGLRYKLRMMGIRIKGPCTVFCDSQAVVLNTTRPESQLKKKHCAIAYHRVREAIAARIIRIVKIDGTENLADILTKPLPGPRLRELARDILW